MDDSNKRQSEDADSQTDPPHKLQRLPKPSIASSAPKKSSTPQTRTGQACDRCKSRKIRCDDTKGGCQPCRQNNAECRTTDRITQRATARGHVEIVENENAYLKQRISELEETLRSNDIDPGHTSLSQVQHSYHVSPRTPIDPQRSLPPYAAQASTENPTVPQEAQKSQETNIFALPAFRASCPGDNYLGVSFFDARLSQIKGLAISVFGMEVDFSEFLADDFEDDRNPTSYSSFATSIMGRPTCQFDMKDTALPQSYEEMHRYALMYIDAVNPWMPVLHRPAFMELVDKLYHDNGFRPTVAETVITQMVLAICKSNVGSRTPGDTEEMRRLYHSAFPHYHYSLNLVLNLTRTRTVTDFQALTLIVIFARNCLTPGPVWGLSSWVLNLAIETGYHRSASAWQDSENSWDPLQIELRKRVFWVLMMMNVSVGGRLGRPMFMRIEDYDVEYPKEIDDRLPSEMDRAERNICSFDLGIEMFKMTELFLDAYSCVYAIRPRNNYEHEVRRLETKAAKWRASLPAKYSLGKPEAENPPMLIAAMWAHYWHAEFTLVLHHPALCRSRNPATISRNLTVCVEAAFTIIQYSARIHAYNALDTNWVNATLYIAAIFTLLFAHWERRQEITSDDFSKLENQMSQCLDMMSILGGPGPHIKSESIQHLRTRVKDITNTALGTINRFLVENTASAAVATASMPQTGPLSPGANSDVEPKSPFVKSEQSNTESATSGQNNYGDGTIETTRQHEPSQNHHIRTSSADNYLYAERASLVTQPLLSQQQQQQHHMQQHPTHNHQHFPQHAASYPQQSQSHYESPARTMTYHDDGTQQFSQQPRPHFAYHHQSPYSSRPTSQHQHIPQQQHSHPFQAPSPYSYDPQTHMNQYQAEAMHHQHQPGDPYNSSSAWQDFARQLKVPQAGSPDYGSMGPLMQMDGSTTSHGGAGLGLAPGQGNMSHILATLSGEAVSQAEGWPASSGFHDHGRGGPGGYG